MPSFPRTLLSREQSALIDMPAGFLSVGHTGGIQARTGNAVGRTWSEEWGPLKRGRPEVEALLVFIEEAAARLVVFDIAHLLTPGSGLAKNGAAAVASATILDAGPGSNQGATITLSGLGPAVTNAIRAGDALRIAGLNPLFRFTSDQSSNGGGGATATISPALPVGYTVPNGTVVTLSNCTLRAMIAGKPEIPAAGPDGWYMGLRVAFREAP
ncbi:MAG TPA: hypothetical protein VF746_13345 [Longimicrobium sp.]